MPIYKVNPTTGEYETDAAGVDSLLNAVLGKETDTSTHAAQDTTGTTTSDGTTSQGSVGSTTGSAVGSTTGSQVGSTTGSQIGSTASNTANTGNTTQATSGTSTTSGTQTTKGTTVNSGTSRTTGTVDTTGSSSTQANSSVTNSADLAALREVYAKQSAGITPEMLAAIFQQGSKAAPNLVLAQSNALGARGVGNTGVAQVLNQLNGDLTSKAADLNRQYLQDSGTTAAHIGDLTRTSNTSSTSNTQTLSQQVQDLMTQTDSTSIVNQIVNSLNSTDFTQNAAGTSSSDQVATGTSNVQTAGTSAQNNTGTSSQNTAGTSANNSSGTTHNTGAQTQNQTASSNTQVQTTINKSVAKGLAGLVAAGVGIDALLKIATGKGFVGTASDLMAYLRGSGIIEANSDYGVSTDSNDTTDYGNVYTEDTSSADVIDYGEYFADGGAVDFLPITPLIKEAPQVARDPDADLNAMLNPRGASAGGAAAASPDHLLSSIASIAASSVFGPIGGAATKLIGGVLGFADGGSILPPIKKPDDSDLAAMLSNLDTTTLAAANKAASPAGVSDSGGDGTGDSAASSSSSSATSSAGNGSNTGMTNSQAATLGAIASAVTGIPGLSIAATAINNSINSASSDSAAADGSADGSAGVDGTGDSSGTGVGAGAGVSGGDNGGGDGTGSGGDSSWANGGEIETAGDNDTIEKASGVEDSDTDDMLAALGITKTSTGAHVNADMLRFMQSKMTASHTKAMSDGGRIVGPGTGTSDSIKAVGPGGRDIRLSNKEYVLPADVVAKVGVEQLDALVAKLHVPAELQGA